MNEKLNEIIRICCIRNIPVSLNYDKETDSLEYKISGFYKSGDVILYEDGDEITCKQRYDSVDVINSFEDLVGINYYWWESSKDRYEGWRDPDSNWLERLIEFGYMKKKEIILTTYVSVK